MFMHEFKSQAPQIVRDYYKAFSELAKGEKGQRIKRKMIQYCANRTQALN